MSRMAHSEPISGVIQEALAISEARAKILAQLKEALLAKDHERAIELATQLCGIEHEPKNN